MAKLSKEEKQQLKAQRKAERKKAGRGLWAEFKAFMNRGNAFMLAVGIVIGGAFSAIVTAFTNILLNLVTATVPGGLAGLVTPIYTSTSINLAAAAGISQDEMVITAANWVTKDAAMRTLYTEYGGQYYYKSMPILNWGALINAIIAFIIIGVVLFFVVKGVAYATAKKDFLAAKALEAYYQKHPEERPVEPEPEAPKPTQEELLTGILAELKKQNEGK